MKRTADFGIIGGGVVGLTVARAILREHPGSRVVVFEKERAVALHASGRNSGVLHAGFYYTPDSLKARLTKRGNELLHEFCAEHSIPVRRTGKVVVTRGEHELPALQELHRRGLRNGVSLEIIDEMALRELEPLAHTHRWALWSPTTSVADPRAVCMALATDVVRHGGRILTGTTVTEVGRSTVTTGAGEWSLGHTVNCAGLFADVFARRGGWCNDYVLLPFKGLYRYADWERNRLQRHVYPVPDARNPFLGVHLTVTVDGRAKIGPTAIPVLSRENYRWLQGLQGTEVIETLRGLARFLSSDAHESASLVRSEVRKYSVENLAADAAQLVPTVRAKDFRQRGKPGIRAQLLDRRSGALEMDFVLRGDNRVTHVLNAVSPAWTGALSFAEFVVADIHRRCT